MIPGAGEAIRGLRTLGLRLLFLTNNGTKAAAAVKEKLDGLGIGCAEEEILTAASVTAEEILRRGLTRKNAFVVGREGIRVELRRVGVEILDGEDGQHADLVIVSGDFEFNYEKMHIASSAVRSGATFIASNDDPTFPDANGLRPGAGAVLASIEAASGRRAEVMGKPYQPMMEAAARRLQGATAIAMVGDQPGTDLAGARSVGWMTILVLSGVTQQGHLAALSPKPDLILDSIAELPEKLAAER